ncbi:MAG TPA: hypothetical protein VNR86_03420 [Sphingomicrobium sp.]|nr:hypothetical protein [Sphingomicrobium sp.]
MKNHAPRMPEDDREGRSADLTRRLARYRTRVEAEGRKRSLEVLDRAIRDAGTGSDTSPDQEHQ